MKYTDPSEFFKFIIEKNDLEVINDTQKCLSMALDLLDSEKQYFKLFKIALIFNSYKELIKAYNKDSNTKSVCLNKALKILTDECCTKDQSAIQTIGWLADVIYPTEWKTFSNETLTKENEEIIWEKPNAWGIYDMHGNVWEWCKNGIIRGGCWSRNAMFCRSASRDSFNQTRRGNFLGFRVAIVPMD